MEFIISDKYDGKTRKLFKKNCKICDDTFHVPKHVFDERFYCSKECASLASRSRLQKSCDFCNEEFFIRPSALKNSKSGLYFCRRECKDKAQRIESGVIVIQPSHYGEANEKYTYRKRALEKYGAKCNQCGYDKDIRMIEVDHILGRKVSHKIEDLQVLCVWCHWIKTRNVTPHNWNGNINAGVLGTGIQP